MAKCRSCEALVIWAQMPSGKMAPFDEEPDPKGQWVIIGGKARREELEDRALMRPMHTSHFATCPDAQQHRRR